nr:Dihydrofolate reductase [uncultured bacterium]
MPDIKFIAAIDDKRGIAKAGKIPWDVPSDRKYFREHVKPGPVVMGWNTFESNGQKPYGDGKNTVITRRDESAPGVAVVHDLEAFFKNLDEDIWVAGGGQVFTAALPYATTLYVTRVKGDYNCDVFFPEFENDFVLSHEEPAQVENGVQYQYQVWQRKN